MEKPLFQVGISPAEGSQVEPGTPVSRMGIPQGNVWKLGSSLASAGVALDTEFLPQQLPYVELGVTLDSCVLYSFSPQDHVRGQEGCCCARDL